MAIEGHAEEAGTHSTDPALTVHPKAAAEGRP